MTELLGEERQRLDADGGVVRARVHARRFLELPTQIAGRRLLADDGLLAARLQLVVGGDREGVHVDVPVGTALGAQAAADAPILDEDLERVATADRAHRAADHAERIAARAARRRHQVLVEAQAVADQAGDALVRVRAGADAEIAAGAALEIDEEQVLRLHQPLREKVRDRHRADLLVTLLVLGQEAGGDLLQLGPDLGKALQHRVEVLAADLDDLHVIERAAGRRANAGAQQPDLPEVTPPGEVAQHHLAAGERLRDLDEADADQEEAVGRLALPANHLPRLVADQLHAVAEVVEEVVGETREHGHAAEMRDEGAFPVSPVEVGLEALVLLQHVEDVSEHLEDDRLFHRAHRRRARVEAHARHLAEDLAGAEARHRIAVVEVDGAVDRDEPRLLLALVLFVAHEPAEPAQEVRDAHASRPAATLHVGHRRGDRHLDLAAQHVEGGGPVLALPADDLARPEAPPDDRAFVEGEERSRAAREDRKPQQLLGGQQVSLRQPDVEHALVGERSRRTRDHALAAAHARGVPHGDVGIERDGRPRPFAHPADDEVLLDLAAGADAPVAQDAGGMVHLDDRRRVVDAPGAEPRRESRRLQSGATRLILQLTVPRGRLPQAGTGMVGQQQLVEHASGPLHALGVRAHVHARLDGPHAGGGEHATAGHLDRAHATDADRSLVLGVTEGRDVDADAPSGVEHGRPCGDLDRRPIDGEIDHAHAHAIGHTPDGHRCRATCTSISSGKCVMTDLMGAGATWPRPQMDVRAIASDSWSIVSRCSAWPRP